MPPVREHYSFRMSVKLTKNYQSVEASAEYGRDANPGEATLALAASVEKFVKGRIDAQMADAKRLLEGK